MSNRKRMRRRKRRRTPSIRSVYKRNRVNAPPKDIILASVDEIEKRSLWRSGDASAFAFANIYVSTNTSTSISNKKYDFSSPMSNSSGDSIMMILRDYERRPMETDNDNRLIRNSILVSIIDKLTAVAIEQEIIYNRIFIKGDILPNRILRPLIKKYNQWISFFMNHCHGGYDLGDPMENGNVPMNHVFIVLMRMHSVLIKCSHTPFWFQNGPCGDILEDNYDVIDNLPPPQTTSASSLRFLPKGTALYRNTPIMQMSLSQLLSCVQILIQNQHNDFLCATNIHSRTHILYYANLIIGRMADFLFKYGDNDTFDISAFSEPATQKGNIQQSSSLFISVAMGHVYLILYLMRDWCVDESIVLERVSYTEVYDDLEDTTSHVDVLHRIRDGSEVISSIAYFFEGFLSGLFTSQPDLFYNFCRDICSDITSLCLIPGTYDYDQLVQYTPDYWQRYVLSAESRMDLLTKYYPETADVVRLYEFRLSESLKPKRSGTTPSVSDQLADLHSTFDTYMAHFMHSSLASKKGFEYCILSDDCELVSLERKDELLRNKHLQTQFMYAPLIIQAVLYIRAISRWAAAKLGVRYFSLYYVVFFHELYFDPIKTKTNLIRVSQYAPIIVQFTPTRFDVVFHGKSYYCKHDIRLTIAMWLSIILLRCNGNLVVQDDNGREIDDHGGVIVPMERAIMDILFYNPPDDDEMEDEGEGEVIRNEDNIFLCDNMDLEDNDFIYQNKFLSSSSTRSRKKNHIQLPTKFNPVQVSSGIIDTKGDSMDSDDIVEMDERRQRDIRRGITATNTAQKMHLLNEGVPIDADGDVVGMNSHVGGRLFDSLDFVEMRPSLREIASGLRESHKYPEQITKTN